jgi:hypothetical protein
MPFPKLIADGAGISHDLTRQVALAQSNPQDLYRRSWKRSKSSTTTRSLMARTGTVGHNYDGKLKTSDESHKAVETMLAS